MRTELDRRIGAATRVTPLDQLFQVRFRQGWQQTSWMVLTDRTGYWRLPASAVLTEEAWLASDHCREHLDYDRPLSIEQAQFMAGQHDRRRLDQTLAAARPEATRLREWSDYLRFRLELAPAPFPLQCG